jgi:hypothetical protein
MYQNASRQGETPRLKGATASDSACSVLADGAIYLGCQSAGDVFEAACRSLSYAYDTEDDRPFESDVQHRLLQIALDPLGTQSQSWIEHFEEFLAY